MTDGESYRDDSEAPYEVAQRNQHDYLLSRPFVGEARLLDSGCGYGTLLERARQRAVGNRDHDSPEQVEYCQSRQLDVVLLDYRKRTSQWNATFDCVIVNGSIEHFIRPENVAAGRADEITQLLQRSIA
jgi:2-polyprenyl-3-methyl-5-hydroxy-6-metoxy-1,4-benzoquinol methylase